MMRKKKIYLETTMFNYYFDRDREDYHVSTRSLFSEIKAGKYDPYTSAYVMNELEPAPKEKREMMLALIEQYSINVLPISREAEKLADMYINNGTISRRAIIDARHIAMAAIYDIEVIVSLNFKHIVRDKTRYGVNSINRENNFRSLIIRNPMEIVDVL